MGHGTVGHGPSQIARISQLIMLYLMRFLILSHVRDWLELLTEACVKLEGMGGSVGAAHSYTWLRRDDVPEKFGEIESSFSEPAQPGDIVLLARKYLHTMELSQRPLVVLPIGRLRGMSDKSLSVLPRLVYSLSQQKNLRDTAKTVEQYPYRLTRAAAYLRALADGGTEFWAPLVKDTLVLFAVSDRVAMPSLWVPPPDVIEPPNSARIIKALPVANKGALKRKRGVGRGKLSAALAIAAGPPPLGPMHGVVDAPHVVGEDGDLAEAEADEIVGV